MVIRSIGQRGGFLLSSIYSILKGFSKNKLPSRTGITRFLSGMSLGFVVGTGINLLGLRWAILISLIAAVVAFLLFLLSKSQRAAATVTCIALLAFIPLRADSPAPQNNQDLNKKVYEQYSKQIDPMVSDINRLRTELQEAQASGDDKRADRLDAELQNAVGRYSEFMTEKRAELESGGGSGKKDQSNVIPPTTREYDDDDDDDDFGGGTGSGTQNSDIERLAGNLVEVARRLYGLGDEDASGE